jgi:hypothetical protein
LEIVGILLNLLEINETDISLLEINESTAALCRICVNAVQLTFVGDNDWSVSDFLWIYE